MNGKSLKGRIARIGILGLAAVTVAIGGGGSASAHAPAAPSSGLYRADKTTRMFAAPDLKATVIGRVPKGTVVSALGPAEGCGAEACVWGKIAFDGHEGWVITRYFESALPIDGTAMANVAVDLRTGPGTHRKVEQVIPAGGEMSLTGQQRNGYVSVEYDGVAGWVQGDALTFYPAPQY